MFSETDNVQSQREGHRWYSGQETRDSNLRAEWNGKRAKGKSTQKSVGELTEDKSSCDLASNVLVNSATSPRIGESSFGYELSLFSPE